MSGAARQSNIQALVGQQTGGIAHDFNNLLVGILGNAELALSDIPADSRTRMYIKDVILSSQRAAELCMQMLAYSGKGRFVVRSLDLNEVINEMISLLRVSISKKAVLKTRLTSTPPIVEADVTQLRQVLMNLITNASDALDDEPGVITITTGHTVLSPENDPYNAMREISAGPYVWFEVNDTGSGMSSETIERMFDPFFTTKPSGRGLGLAAVSGIIRGHGGTFRVYSEPNSGTTFKVFLPSRIGDPFQEPQRPTVQVAKPGGLVLIVDDEPGVRRVARRVAERAGFEVIEAADGQAAVEIFKEHHHEIAVVLLDMSMPAMSGEETFRAMREITPDVRVILSSGYNEQDATSYFVGRGLAGFLQKPYRPSDLFALLQAAVE